MKLYNKIDSRILKKKLIASKEKRTTISFYKYVQLKNVSLFRDHLYVILDRINVFGRIYLASEGINAQISVPDKNLDLFKSAIEDVSFLNNIRLNMAIEDNGKSFFKLKIKIREKILADGLNDDTFDVTNIGKHLSAEEFNNLSQATDTMIVDMRNHYESEVGYFKNAYRPDADTFQDALRIVVGELKNKVNQNIIMYCTGGIRCEKASAYFKHLGFPNIYQLEGGIIKYARDVKDKGLENKYIGKNFVFDERLGERISDDIISFCHQCGKPSDAHTNCKNVACNVLFIQCEECASLYDDCCSNDCKEIIKRPEVEQKLRRKGKSSGGKIFSKGRIKFQDKSYIK
jgi:UPF0176 protein